MAHGSHIFHGVHAADGVDFDVFLIMLRLRVPRRTSQKVIEVHLFFFAREQSSQIANEKTGPRISGARISGDPNHSGNFVEALAVLSVQSC